MKTMYHVKTIQLIINNYSEYNVSNLSEGDRQNSLNQMYEAPIV